MLHQPSPGLHQSLLQARQRPILIARTQLGGQKVSLVIEQQQRVITSRFEVPVVGAFLLLAVDRDLGAVHVQHYTLPRID